MRLDIEKGERHLFFVDLNLSAFSGRSSSDKEIVLKCAHTNIPMLRVLFHLHLQSDCVRLFHSRTVVHTYAALSFVSYITPNTLPSRTEKGWAGKHKTLPGQWANHRLETGRQPGKF